MERTSIGRREARLRPGGGIAAGRAQAAAVAVTLGTVAPEALPRPEDGARAGAHLLGPELGTFVGAVVAGVFGNVYANARHGPASVPIVPGVMMLVPGSFGFRSLSSLLARDVLSGLEIAFLTVLAAVPLGTGLLVANVLVPPRRAL